MKVKAWHFMRDNRRLGFGDDRLMRKGATLVHRGPLKMCVSGLHGSISILDALQYSPGNIICRVEMSGEIEFDSDFDSDKLVAERRKCIWWVDGERLLWKFARLCVLDVVHLWTPPAVVLKYLRTGDETIKAAAWAAAGGAVRDAAGDAAGAAAGGAARAAAWGAVGAAAGGAAWVAAWAAAGAAARAAAWGAARVAAGGAARVAAGVKQKRRLERMVYAARRKDG